jgi:uncharacterized membrane protein
MATVPVTPSPVRSYRKPILWAGIAVMALSVLFTVELPLFRSASPHRQHLLVQNFILIPHVISGLAAFLIGPFQLSSRFRQRNLRLHRILGKVYVIAIFISVPSALILGNGLPSPLIVAADSQAVLWFICTAAAFLTARNRHIAQHRVWMIRSYSVTLIFFTSRVLIPIPAYGNMSPTGIATSLFLLQLSAILVPEIALHWSALTTRRR